MKQHPIYAIYSYGVHTTTWHVSVTTKEVKTLEIKTHTESAPRESLETLWSRDS